MILPVAESPCHKLQWKTKTGIENNCLKDLPNLVGCGAGKVLGKVELVGYWWSEDLFHC